jgi:hypothetical protein
MTVKSKTALGRVRVPVHEQRHKHTRQGNGTRSLPSHGRKLKRGQGK